MEARASNIRSSAGPKLRVTILPVPSVHAGRGAEGTKECIVEQGQTGRTHMLSRLSLEVHRGRGSDMPTLNP